MMFTKYLVVVDDDVDVHNTSDVLFAATSGAVSYSDMRNWIEEDNEAYFKKVLGGLHAERLIEWNVSQNTITLWPPGTTEAEGIIRKHMA